MSTSADQLPRNALLWLIVCQVALLAPLLLWLPPWILLVSLAVSVWRFQVFEGRWSYPGRWSRALLGVSAAVAVYVSFQSLLGLEPMVALLLVTSALKLLEARAVRDGYVLAILGFFICLTVFLFDQSLPSALYVLICVALLLTALIALNESPLRPVTPRTLRISGGLLVQALPLMVLPFLLFPRISPLWEVPIKRHSATTGMSDTLSPGDVAQLGQNDAVAFRVKFDGETPPGRALYWRGLTMGRFDDGTWRQHALRQQPRFGRLMNAPQPVGNSLRYQIIQLPTQQRWLYGIRYAESESQRIVPINDYRFVASIPLEFEFGYQVESWPATPLELELPDWRRDLETRYPAARDPRTRDMVARWRAEAPEPRAIVRRALRWFREQPFTYTLRPTPIDDDDFVDAFLFGSRRGFCEHFAYSFTVMMRQAGIPARIVAGYQGGEVNPVNDTVVVRQMDAHAWSEVWLAGEGWVRVDPTAAVSPDRIELGLAQTLGADEGFLVNSPMSAMRFGNIGVVTWLRLRYDALAWQWQSLVVGFGGDTQIQVLKRLLGDITPLRVVLFLLIGSALILAPGAWILFRPTRSALSNSAEREFVQFCKTLAGFGAERRRGEAPRHFAQRGIAAAPPDQRDALQATFERIERDLYGTASSRDSVSER